MKVHYIHVNYFASTALRLDLLITQPLLVFFFYQVFSNHFYFISHNFQSKENFKLNRTVAGYCTFSNKIKFPHICFYTFNRNHLNQFMFTWTSAEVSVIRS